MRLFEKMTKILRENDLAKSYAEYVIDDYKSLEVKLNKWREVSLTLSKTRRKNQVNERKELVEHLFRILDYFESSYTTYIYDLYDLCHYLKNNPSINPTKKASNKILLAINTKQQLRKEFETIYTTFKNMAKKLDDIPMKEILKRMREVFDFNSTKTNEELKYVEEKYQPIRYYDSTTMTIRTT